MLCRCLAAIVACLLLAYPCVAAEAGFRIGDVVIGANRSGYPNHVQGSTLAWFRADGSFQSTLAVTTSNTLGDAAFDPLGNLYAVYTDNLADVIRLFDRKSGAYLGNVGNFTNPPHPGACAITFDASGAPWLATGTSCEKCYTSALVQLGPNGEFVHEDGVPWLQYMGGIDLAQDQCTMYVAAQSGRPGYTHPVIARHDICRDHFLPDFLTTAAPAGFRILPDGGVLATSGTKIDRLDADGILTQQYGMPGCVSWSSIALDPDRTSFWGGCSNIGAVRFDLRSGSVVGSPIPSPDKVVVVVAVVGEPRAALTAKESIPVGSGWMFALLGGVLLGIACMRLQ